MIKNIFTVFIFGILFNQLAAQESIIYGQIFELNSHTPIAGVNLQVEGHNDLYVSDLDGKFNIVCQPGLHNIVLSHVAFQNEILYEVRATTTRPTWVDVYMSPMSLAIEEVTLQASRIMSKSRKTNSIQRLDIDEIQRLPGATMDFSKVIKTLPGVVPKVSFGYNLIVRGGGSFENKFFLDGIEIPAITHFNVQGLSGGPNGLLNTDLIQQANFNSGAFPTNRANALSSVLEMEQKTGRKDRIGGKVTLGASEYGIHLEGPLTKKSSYIISARKSYTEYLLKAFNVPVLPAFTDFQYKHQFQLGKQDELNIMALATSDVYRLNKDGEATESLLYNIGYIPEGEQKIKVFGARYKHFTDNGVYCFIVSQDRLNNSAEKFSDNSNDPTKLVLKYSSKDVNTRFKIENKIYFSKAEFSYGVDYNFSNFNLDQYAHTVNQSNTKDTIDFESNLRYQQYGFFVSYDNKLGALNYFVGARADGNNYASQMENPFKQFSPRMGMSYDINSKLRASIQTGIYYQLPPSTLLAFQKDDKYVNQETIKYIQSSQVSGGLHYSFSKFRSLSIDGFYKKYKNYPFLLQDSISFANAAGEYVAIGNQPATSSNAGRATGIELFYQQKLKNNWFGNISTSYIISQFENESQQLVSSSWDSRFFLNTTIGKQMKKNWTMGLRWTYAGGSPYTPYDLNTSSNIDFWNSNQRGILDYSQLNSQRLPAFHQMDFRIDKKWYLKKATILLFLDIQNLYNNKFEILPYLTVERDTDGNPIINDANPSQYKTKIIKSDTGRMQPTIGFSIEF